MAFIPPYPKPRKKGTFLFWIIRGWNSWINLLTVRTYQKKSSRVRILGLQAFIFNDPESVDAVMIKEQKKFPKHSFMHEMLEPLLGNSIFTTNGGVWERQRALVDQAFEKANLKLVFPLMLGAVNDMLERLDKIADGRSYEIDQEATYVTADVMFRTILSEELDAKEASEIYDSFLIFQHQAHKHMLMRAYRLGLPEFLVRRSGKKAARRIREVLARIIKKRYDLRSAGVTSLPADILTAMIDARDPKKGDSFEYPEMVDQICMLFLAGHETSATAMGWSLYLISRCSHLQEQMLAEIRMVIGDREIQYGDTNKLKVVYDVFRESLRLYPPVACFIREATETVQVGGREVGPGGTVLISPWLIQRHEELWERPHEFDPSRFSTAEGKASAKCSYLPFSKGPRVCVGQGFAIQEAVLILASIVRRYRIEPDNEHTPKPMGRVTLRSGNGIRVRFIRR
jgi:cytochrome P450